MVRSQFLRICLGLLLAVGLASGSPAIASPPQAPPGDLTVSAAISLKDSLDEIAQLYRARRPEQIVRFNFGGSGTLLLQIEQNAPVDMFISASPEEMNKLASRSLLLQGTRKDLLKNQIVLIVPQGNKAVSSFEDLAKPEIRFIAVGEPQTVPAGKYAQEVLTHLGLYDRLKSKFVMGSDVRQVLTYVSTGNADAGIVYATDAQISPQVRVVLAAPEDSHSPVIYPVGVIKASKNPAAARDFENFLVDPQARAVFKKHGFVPINP
jgi:molybdate transport system substrate-binding protein